MNRILKCLFLFVLLLWPFSTASAEIKNISTTGTYIAGASESLNDAKQHALDDAMRLATEQAGVLVSSYSKTENMELTEDEVSTVATRIVKVLHKDYDVQLLSDSEIQVKVSIEAQIDTDSIQDDIVQLKQRNEELGHQNDQLQKAIQNEKNNRLSAYQDYEALRDYIQQAYKNETKSYANMNYRNIDSFNSPIATLWRGFALAMANNDTRSADSFLSGIMFKKGKSDLDGWRYNIASAEVDILKRNVAKYTSWSFDNLVKSIQSEQIKFNNRYDNDIYKYNDVLKRYSNYVINGYDK